MPQFLQTELPEELLEGPYQRPRGPTQPIGIQSPDGTIIHFDHPDLPENLNYPESLDESPDDSNDIAIEDYKPEMVPLNFSRYELPEEAEEVYEHPRGPMQPIAMGSDAGSQISSDVSDQPATPSEFFAHTGGEGQYTQWVHCELIVGSETIRLAHIQWVNGGHFQKVPTHSPSPNPAGK